MQELCILAAQPVMYVYGKLINGYPTRMRCKYFSFSFLDGINESNYGLFGIHTEREMYCVTLEF